MRVTKLIREYVVKRVNENYPKTEVELAYEAHESNIDNAIAEANKIFVEYANKLAEELNAKYGFSEDDNLKANSYYNAVFHKKDYNSEFCQEYCKAREERRMAISEKIEEILLTLELGGTKADLDEMLKNVGK